MVRCVCRCPLRCEARRLGTSRSGAQQPRQTRRQRGFLLRVVGPSVQNFVEDKREAGPKAEVLANGLEVNRVSAIRVPRREAHRDVC